MKGEKNRQKVKIRDGFLTQYKKSSEKAEKCDFFAAGLKNINGPKNRKT